MLFAIPYSQPIIASKAVVLGDYTTVIFGIICVTAFTVLIMYIASRLFAMEKILTAKLKFRRKESKEENRIVKLECRESWYFSNYLIQCQRTIETEMENSNR